MTEANSGAKPDGAKPARSEDTQAQLAKLNKQLEELRAEKYEEERHEETRRAHGKSVAVMWAVGIIIAVLIIVGIIAAVNNINYHKEQAEKAENQVACSVYPTWQERHDCETSPDPDNYDPDTDHNVNGGF